MKATANVNGVITPIEDAKIPVLDRGFLYGDSIYEVTSTINAVPLHFKEHMERLENSSRLAKLPLHLSHQEIYNQIKRTVQESGAVRGQDEIYVRLIITRGEGAIDLDPKASTQNNYVILVKQKPNWNQKFYDEGVHLAIPSVRRNPTEALNPNIKGGNYLNNVLAVAEAKDLGADDAVILNRKGEFTEASNSNISFVINGEVATPADESGNLKGITRTTLHKLCQVNKIPFHLRLIKVEDLKNATECFVSSATRGVMPVKSIRLENGEVVTFPSGGGNVTKRLGILYNEDIQEHVKEFANLALY